jgi:flap endonuclease-1
MGVEGLHQYLLHNISKESKIIQKIHLCDISGKTIAIDASIYVYKYFVNNDYKMLKGGIKKMLDEFKMNRITPIFVFDGKPPKMKDSALNKRKQEKDIIDNMDEINNITKVKYNEKSIRPNRDTIIFVKNILDSKNVKYINAPNEADPVCAWLVKTGKAWACLSDDTDMFIYGCTRVLRSYSINNKSLMFYDFNKILEHLDLTFDQFREICVVSGTDYNNNDMNMNVNTVFQLYHEYKTNHVNIGFIHWLYERQNIIEEKGYYDILELMDITNITYIVS